MLVRFLLLIGFAAIGLSACGPGDRADVIYVYAAASLQSALAEIHPAFELESGIEVKLNASSSGTLSVQIEQGGRCDVFLSAGEEEMDRLVDLGLVHNETRRTLLSNQLVVIVAKGEGTAVRTPADLAGDAVRHLSIANTESVPAGRYAKEWLVSAGLWDAVRGKVVPATHVRAALAQVEFGGAEAGVVYRTDADISKRVEVAYAVPVEEGPEISYPAAAMKGRRRVEQSQRYLDFLQMPAAQDVFVRNGFLVHGN